MSTSATALLMCVVAAAPTAAPTTATPAATPPATTAAPAATLSMTPKAIRMRQVMRDPNLRAQYSRATTVGDSGLAIAGVGLGIGLLVGIPIWASRDKALDQAADAEFTVERAAPLAAAQRRLQALRVTLAVSGSFFAVGTTLAIVGYRRRARLTRGLPTTLSLAPAVGGGQYGATATVRF